MLQYQGLYDGQNYVPQNEQSGANQNIHANIWIVYYTNMSSNIGAQMDNSQPSPEVDNDDSSSYQIVEILREEECATRDE